MRHAKRSAFIVIASIYLQPHSPRLSPVYNGDYRVFDTRHIVLDPSKLMKLGWKCDIDLKEVLKRHAEWFLKYAKSQNVAEIFTEAYGQQLQDGAIKRIKILTVIIF